MAKGIVSSGIPALDQALFHNGFRKGSVVLVVGDHSARKDLFGSTILREGILSGEDVAFYDVESSSDEILEIMQEKLDPHLLPALHFMDACPEYTKFFINAVPARIIEDMRGIRSDKVNRVLVNPFTFFLEKFGLDDAGDFLIMVREIAMEKDLVVVFLMADILSGKEMQSIIDKFVGIIELRTVEIQEGYFHTLDLKKFSMQQKRVKLTYNVIDSEIRITSTGRVL